MSLSLQERIPIIQDILTQLDQAWTDFMNKQQTIAINPPTQMQIDEAVVYAQKNLAYEESMKNLFEQYDIKRRSLLGRLLELKPLLDVIISTNVKFEQNMAQAIQIDREQVSVTLQAQQAFKSNNISLWNSSIQRMNVLRSEYENCKAEGEVVATQQSAFMDAAKTMLQNELNVLQNPPTAGQISATAKKLSLLSQYQPNGNNTKCSEFVRDFANDLGYSVLYSELSGQVVNQVNTMKQNRKEWEPLIQTGNNDGLVDVFKEAQDRANQGDLVIVAYVLPTDDPRYDPNTNTGHIAVVVPNQGLYSSGTWNMQVPYIAQAGKKVKDKIELGDGFTSDMKKGLVIFALKE